MLEAAHFVATMRGTLFAGAREDAARLRRPRRRKRCHAGKRELRRGRVGSDRWAAGLPYFL